MNVISLQNDTDFDGVYPPQHPNVDDISKGQPDGSGPSSTGAPQLITHAACPNAWYIFNAAFGNVDTEHKHFHTYMKELPELELRRETL